jgi:sugar O-acyltransferase (sialic acid O-acetyltransferase NeuD family)
MNLTIFGTGGQASEVLDVVLKSRIEVSDIQFCVSEPTTKVFQNFELIAWRDLLARGPENTLLHLGIGDPLVRLRLTSILEKESFQMLSVISSSASVSPTATIDSGCFVGDFSFVGPRVKLGKSVLINNSVSVSHDGVIGNFTTVCPGARLNGHVRIEDGAFIGSGAVLKNGKSDFPLVVGANSTIGAGSVVISNIEIGAVVAGNPAKQIIKQGIVE